MLLKNKSAVVYGAGGSIGGAVAAAFAREGARVFLVGRTVAGLESVVTDIAELGGMATPSAVDAFDERAVENHLADAVRMAGQIDIVFNAISIAESSQGTPLLDLSPEAISLPVMRRVASNFLTARVAAKHMVVNGSGVILMMTASPARMAWPLTGSFGIECAAIEGLCRSLASEVSPQGVRVICIRSAGSPEAFPEDPNDGFGKAHAEMTAMISGKTFLKRTPSLAEVGNVAALMASDYASPMTATVANMTCGSIAD